MDWPNKTKNLIVAISYKQSFHVSHGAELGGRDGRQKSDDRNQRTGIRKQESENRNQKTGDREF